MSATLDKSNGWVADVANLYTAKALAAVTVAPEPGDDPNPHWLYDSIEFSPELGKVYLFWVNIAKPTPGGCEDLESPF